MQIDDNILAIKDVSILLIEDNKKDIKLINEYLDQSKKINATVKIVDRIKKAKTILFYEKFDIILVDIKVEGITPDELFDTLGNEKLSIPYIVITDERDEDIGIIAVKKGAQDYLVRSELSERILRRTILYSLERHEILESLYKTTIKDELTGLYNRRGLYTLGNQQIELAKRHDDDIFVFFLDLDGMKDINDKFGHEAGDDALVRSTAIIHKSFRNTDILSRVGGDEFIILAVKAQYEFVPVMIERIKEYVNKENTSIDNYQLSLSIGVSKINLDDESPLDEAIKKADKEMYKSKVKNKKNRK